MNIYINSDRGFAHIWEGKGSFEGLIGIETESTFLTKEQALELAKALEVYAKST